MAAAPGTFTYRLPADLEGAGVEPGVRVLAPFGRRPVVGFVVAEVGALPEGLDPAKVRPIADVLDPAPLVGPALLDLLSWAAAYYMAPLGEFLRAALPAGLHGEARRMARRTAAGARAGAGGTGPRAALLEALAEGEAECRALLRRVGGGARMRHLAALAADGLVELDYAWSRARGGARTEVRWRPVSPPPAGPPLTARRAAVLDAVRSCGVEGLTARRVAGLAGGAGVGPQLRWLATAGLVERFDAQVLRDPFAGTPTARDRAPAWSDEQAGALEVIGAALAAGGYHGVLLHGVTGSGKTEVYLEAIRRVTETGRQALVLVPEIALTPQLAGRFRARFGDRVAVLHSGLSDGERCDEWRRIRAGEAPIALGARSAVFAPLDRLGIVVVDEEHDPSYKQDESPRYDAKNLALVRARRAGAVAVLGSATPSLESHHGAATDRLRRAVMSTRPTGGPLPGVALLDLRRTPPDSPLTPALRQALAATLAAGEQAILFLNRRGWSAFVVCRDCGRQWGCPNCSVGLKHHRGAAALRCHYCDHAEPMPRVCPDCKAPEPDLFGLGTERLEAAVRELLPAARVARLDRDTVGRRGELRDILDAVRRGDVDVLVGTQMVTKGHDFPGVTLVGVVAADLSLNLPDFRAAERTFQLLTQVAGRAGRGDRPGRVLIQSFQPEHYALIAAREQDYGAFAARELAQREALGYPPFGHLVAVRLDGPDEARVRAAAGALGRALAEALARPGTPPTAVLGPAAAPLSLLRGRHRWQVLVKGKDRAGVRAVVRQALRELPGRDLRAVRLAVDVDPIHML